MSQAEIFFSETEDLKIENQSLKIQVKIEQEKNKNYAEEVERLHEMLAELKRSKFGVKSERWETDEQMVFNEVEFFSKQPEPASDDKVTVSEHTKNAATERHCQQKLQKDYLKILRAICKSMAMQVIIF